MTPSPIIHQRDASTFLEREIEIPANEKQIHVLINTLPFSIDTKTAFRFILNRGSHLAIWNLMLGGGESNLSEHIEFRGENGVSENHTVYFGESSQNFQMFITYLHEAPDCTSRISSRGILKDTAIGRYDGIIKILQSGQRADALLDEKTLLLSPDAKSEATPALEIGTNNVKAAHSASCTRVDEVQLFYAASRGIPEEEALRMIAEGFLKDLLDRLPIPSLKRKTLRMIQKKLDRQNHA